MDTGFATTALRQAFFSTSNLNAVQTALEREVKAKGYAISRQSDVEVLGVMRGVFETYSADTPHADPAEIRRLNGIVHKVLCDQVITGIQQYLGYVKDASTLPEPLARGINASSKGDRVLELRK